jgi:hypothetical protein
MTINGIRKRMDIRTEIIIGNKKKAANENRIYTRFIGKQPNLINNNLMRETSFGTNLVNISPLRELSQDDVQENRHWRRREKEVQRLSQKLNNQNLRSLSVTSGNKRIEYFPEEI